ncbi:hypothetical protein CJD36_009345 [Flavipsychrobacter stenotrophus]|uniref:Uncharacterized protein n=1 Tax=Flavipsychrobacter stenotrophus TaxID=2077091 RepID=A0A2S7SZ39_9BACT|nr:addiction module protein [Flavipsychrobacter stenotrophus]PQJ11984.1 hypothetical protein CJD36_009345 [Flavipsychrobacter stenotrophus]
MVVNPQYLFDAKGNTIGVFLSIDGWDKLATLLQNEIPDWQKKLIDTRLEEYSKDSGNTLDWDEIAHKL